MAFLLLLGAVLTILVIAFLSKRRVVLSKQLPIASGSTIFGPVVDFGKDPVAFLTQQRKKHGNVFFLDLFIIKFVFALGGRNTNMVLTAPEEKASFWDFIFEQIGTEMRTPYNFRSPHGLEWLPISLKTMRVSLNDQTRIRAWNAQWTELAREHFENWAKSETPVDVFASVSNLLMDCSFAAMMGLEYTRAHARALYDDMREYESSLTAPLVKIFPKIMTPGGRAVNRIIARVNESINDECRRRLENPEKYKGTADYLQSYLDPYGDELLPCYAMHFMVVSLAAHVNTAGSFSWTLLHALRSGKIDMLTKEAQSATFNKEDSCYSFSQMPYTEAALRETGRMYGNLLVARKMREHMQFYRSEKSDEIIDVPPGVFVVTSPLINCRNEDVGIEKPDKWIPERFMQQDNYQRWFKSNEFVQFGFGKHPCLGEKFTHNLLRGVLWPIFFREYDVKLVGGINEGCGMDNVGVEPNWSGNIGTPFAKTQVLMRVTKK